ncbi:MAG: Crp/Fnr family transcriptional regulator [Acidobacteriota bacterium]
MTAENAQLERLTVLSSTRLFGDGEPKDLLELASVASERRLAGGAYLFSAGDPSRGLFVVVTGRTRAVRHGIDGREQIIHEDGPGSTFPEVAVFDDGPYPSSVVAVEDSLLLFIPKQEVRAFCLRHPGTALRALRILSGRLRRATGMVEDLSLRDVSQRLAEYVLGEARKQAGAGRPQVVELVHSNQEIGDLIGTVREVVSRSFAKLQRRGWIRKQGHCVEILDEAGLVGHVEGE